MAILETGKWDLRTLMESWELGQGAKVKELQEVLMVVMVPDDHDG